MKAILPELERKSVVPVYIQLFEYIKKAIACGEIVPGEKLPSLRNLSDSLGISITTARLAYEQLEAEGYISSRPRSGYYVRDIFRLSYSASSSDNDDTNSDKRHALKEYPAAGGAFDISSSFPSVYDLSSFDFVKWKKCFSSILNEYPQTLLSESDPQGEKALRQEISRYVFSSRGVRCSPDQIVIAAGTQQLTSLLASLLKEIGTDHVALEDPGYHPILSSFQDRGFAITKIPVAPDGIVIEKLPANISAAAYVNPSNQFPTGAVMPISRRYMLLEWAATNSSFIIEDDYDSELRYIGKPIPALQGLDENDRVIYLGSFSSTLFAAVKISYMVMPSAVAAQFAKTRGIFTQTCSKAEQLTLALFMHKGYYQTGIKKLRRINSQKLRCVISAFEAAGVKTKNTNSGINIILDPNSSEKASLIMERASAAGLRMTSFMSEDDAGGRRLRLVLYYDQIPLNDIPVLIEQLVKK